MHYCIGDVHGCFDDMIALVNKIKAKDKEAEIIFIGDFIDRGPKVWETLEWVAERVANSGAYKGVQGNHEQLVLQWYFKWRDWYAKQPLKDRLLGRCSGEDEPKTDYDFYDVAKAHNMLKPMKLNRYMATFMALPTHIELKIPGKDKKPIVYDIVHAWYSYDYPDHSYGQRLFNVFAREVNGNYANDHIIIHGHTPTITDSYTYDHTTVPGMIAYRKNAINIDGGCVYHKDLPSFPCMLCGLCLETLEEIYPYTLEERMGEKKARWFKKIYLSGPNEFRKEMLERLIDPAPL